MNRFKIEVGSSQVSEYKVQIIPEVPVKSKEFKMIFNLGQNQLLKKFVAEKLGEGFLSEGNRIWSSEKTRPETFEFDVELDGQSYKIEFQFVRKFSTLEPSGEASRPYLKFINLLLIKAVN